MARLRILESAEGAGRVVRLTGVEFLVGRDDTCDVVVRDRSLSRRHARFAPAVGGWLVIDGQLQLGVLVAFNGYLLMMQMPFRFLGFFLMLAQRAAASAGR